MKIKKTIEAIVHAFLSNRGEGHTSIMMHGAVTTPKATVITADLRQANNLRTSHPGIRVISLAQLESLVGYRGAIAIDHNAIEAILTSAHQTICEREDKLRQTKRDLLKITEAITSYLKDEA